MSKNDLEIAEMMIDMLNKSGYLYQDEVVSKIASKFGEPYFYYNQSGNLAISKTVLKEFKTLTGDAVVWERGERCWRKRLPSDELGRRGQE
ncbi:DUF6953 family protein [Methylobacterium iners]|uniref:DUF6953 family protein n=1 Tax=Methylobacterium iners TaxID=418707 RepID=UPI001EE2FC40|nr:hypothetical protein [Methylobacterium iners]